MFIFGKREVKKEVKKEEFGARRGGVGKEEFWKRRHHTQQQHGTRETGIDLISIDTPSRAGGGRSRDYSPSRQSRSEGREKPRRKSRIKQELKQEYAKGLHEMQQGVPSKVDMPHLETGSSRGNRAS